MQIHVVQRGENLWTISRQSGVGLNQIAGANELPDPNRLVIGQALVIPDPYREYIVQPGDNLWLIAQRFGTNVEALMRANRLTSPSLIYPGQTLTIPVLYHTVSAGETLWSISRRYGTTVQAIMQANRITDPAMIYPGQTIRIPEKTKPEIEVNAFTIQFGEAGAQTAGKVSPYLTYISPFAYRIQADGGLTPIDDANIIQAAVSNRAVPLMAITNFTARELGTELAHTILVSPELQNKLLDNIVSVMHSKGYRGLNVDFENVSPADRELYNQFLRRMTNRMHQEGFSASSSLAPKVRADQPGLLYEAHDYRAHGEILDFVVLMTYEWGYRFGPPQAISPIDQIRRVLDYAVTVIPRNKIFMGFQIYARDWLLPHVQGQQAETFSMQEAVSRAVQYGTVIQYDPKSQSPYYRYTDAQGRMHEVWFEDARSAQAKFDTVKSYNLRGVSYWVLGYPFPQNWLLLQDNFHIRKI